MENAAWSARKCFLMMISWRFTIWSFIDSLLLSVGIWESILILISELSSNLIILDIEQWNMKYPSDSDDFMVHIISVQYTFQKWNRKMRYLCTSFHQPRYPSWTRFGTLIKYLNISVEQIYWWLLVKINLDLIVGQSNLLVLLNYM